MSGEVSSKKTAGKQADGADNSARSDRVTVRVPASTSNLGPGFDTLGLAFQLYNTITFELLDSDDPNVEAVRTRGEIAAALPADKTNLTYRTLAELWKDSPDLLKRVRITIDTQIPLSGGLGSSASATLGAVWASRKLSGQDVDYEYLLTKATSFEGHPDNVTPSLYGGFVVCAGVGDRTLVQRFDWPEDWCTIVIAPHYSVSTKEARALLPENVPLKDAVSNIQKVSLLIASVIKRDEEAFSAALEDRIHEPYRQRLVPELGELKKELAEMPVLGCVLSGAGSSVLVPVARRHKEKVVEFLNGWAARKEIPPKVLDLQVAQRGIEQLDSAE